MSESSANKDLNKTIIFFKIKQIPFLGIFMVCADFHGSVTSNLVFIAININITIKIGMKKKL
ncbi:hypothetical protein BDFB_014062, partial [Asbolus verrucosus]